MLYALWNDVVSVLYATAGGEAGKLDDGAEKYVQVSNSKAGKTASTKAICLNNGITNNKPADLCPGLRVCTHLTIYESNDEGSPLKYFSVNTESN
ncbi:hypothetical protein JCM10914A_23460 [Paenibacillus sp. JCM 10914]